MVDSKKLPYVIIVTFNPNFEQVLNNIQKIKGYVEKIILVDNHSDNNKSFIERIKRSNISNIEAIMLNSNRGVGYAQNLGIKRICKEKAKIENPIVFLDQDSYYTGEQLYRITTDFLKELSRDHTVAMIGPSFDPNVNEASQFTSVKEIISSGSVTNIETFRKLGIFKSEFFIDFIDYEWCWRATDFGLKILRDNQVFLHHQINGQLRKRLGKKITPTFRIYYVCRNLVYCLIRCPLKKGDKMRWCLKLFINAAFQCIFGNNPKLNFIRVIRGIKDGINGKMGKYEENYK